MTNAIEFADRIEKGLALHKAMGLDMAISLTNDSALALAEMLRFADKMRAEIEELRSAEKRLSAAYVRLRTMIPGALDTPHAPTPEQIYEQTEKSLRAIIQ